MSLAWFRQFLLGPVQKGETPADGLFQKVDGSVWIQNTDGSEDQVGSGGSQPGAVRWYSFAFAYDTPDLTNGVVVYTPTPSDLLLGATLLIATAWDGTTPLGDIGWAPFNDVAGAVGLYNYAWGAAYDMSNPALYGTGDTGIGPVAVLDGGGDLLGLSAAGQAYDQLRVPAIPVGGSAEQELTQLNPNQAAPAVPLQFQDASPLSVCVSQTGKTGGADPGSTQGAATLYFAVATPATSPG